jgi:hypothetical protein
MVGLRFRRFRGFRGFRVQGFQRVPGSKVQGSLDLSMNLVNQNPELP